MMLRRRWRAYNIATKDEFIVELRRGRRRKEVRKEVGRVRFDAENFEARVAALLDAANAREANRR